MIGRFVLELDGSIETGTKPAREQLRLREGAGHADPLHILDPGPEGRTLPALAAIDGRTNDLLITRDGRRVYWLNPVFYGLPVREAQIVQEQLERLRVRYTPAPGFSADTAREIVARLRARMGAVAVEVEEVAVIAHSAAGQLRAVVCELPPDEKPAVLARRAPAARGTAGAG